MLTDYLTGINLVLRLDEEFATVLEMVNGIGLGITSFESDERTIGTSVYLSLERLILLESVRHDGLTLRSGKHIGSEANDTTRGNIEFDIDTLALAHHAGHLALATCDHINHLATEFLWHIDGKFLNGFATHTVNLLVNNLWLTYLQLVAFATHGYNQNGQVQDTTTTHYPAVGISLERRYSQCQILLQLLVETIQNVSAGAELAFLAKEGRIIDGKEH